MLEAYSYQSAPDETTIKSILFEDLHSPEHSAEKTMIVINRVLNEFGLGNIGSMTNWTIHVRKELSARCRKTIKEL
jgi:hypothetical protein